MRSESEIKANFKKLNQMTSPELDEKALFQKSFPQVKSESLTPEEFLTTHELMRLLKIKHRATIYELIKNGMPVIKVGKSYRFLKSEVIEFFKRQRKS